MPSLVAELLGYSGLFGEDDQAVSVNCVELCLIRYQMGTATRLLHIKLTSIGRCACRARAGAYLDAQGGAGERVRRTIEMVRNAAASWAFVGGES